MSSPCAYKAKYSDGKLVPLKLGDKSSDPKPCGMNECIEVFWIYN